MPQEPKIRSWMNTAGKRAQIYDRPPVTYYRWRQSVTNPLNKLHEGEVRQQPDLMVDFVFRDDGKPMQAIYRVVMSLMVKLNWLNLDDFFIWSSKNAQWIIEPYQAEVDDLGWEFIATEEVPEHIRYHHDLDRYLRPKSAKGSAANFNPRVGWHKVELPDRYFVGGESKDEVWKRLSWIRRRRLLMRLGVLVGFVWLTQPWLVPLVQSALNAPYELRDWLLSFFQR